MKKEIYRRQNQKETLKRSERSERREQKKKTKKKASSPGITALVPTKIFFFFFIASFGLSCRQMMLIHRRECVLPILMTTPEGFVSQSRHDLLFLLTLLAYSPLAPHNPPKRYTINTPTKIHPLPCMHAGKEKKRPEFSLLSGIPRLPLQLRNSRAVSLRCTVNCSVAGLVRFVIIIRASSPPAR